MAADLGLIKSWFTSMIPKRVCCFMCRHLSHCTEQVLGISLFILRRFMYVVNELKSTVTALPMTAEGNLKSCRPLNASSDWGKLYSTSFGQISERIQPRP